MRKFAQSPESAASGKAECSKHAEKHQAVQAAQHATPKHPSLEAAQTTYHCIKHGAFDWGVNSVLSLMITYNAMPSKAVQRGISKVTGAITPAVRALGANHPELKARSAIETGFMCCAGFAILPFMQYMTHHQNTIEHHIAHKLDPEFYNKNPEAREKDLQKAREADAQKIKTSNLPKLIGSRLAALAFIVFGLDQGVEAVNNHLMNKGKPNLDTLYWKNASHAYDKMPTGLRDRLIGFSPAVA